MSSDLTIKMHFDMTNELYLSPYFKTVVSMSEENDRTIFMKDEMISVEYEYSHVTATF